MILWVGLVSCFSTALRYNRNFKTQSGEVTKPALGSPWKGRADLSSGRSWARARPAALKPCWPRAGPPGQDMCMGQSQVAACIVSFLSAEAGRLRVQVEKWKAEIGF